MLVGAHTECRVAVAVNGSSSTTQGPLDASGASLDVSKDGVVTVHVAPFAVHMRQGKGCAWDLEVAVVEGTHGSVKAGGVLGETLHWSGAEQSALRGSLMSYLGDEAKGVVQHLDLLGGDLVVVDAPRPRQRAVAFGAT